MTKKLEEILNIDPKKEKIVETPTAVSPAPTIDLQEKLEEFDKIASALPRVKGLGDMADGELDALAAKAEQAYDDLMDLGMNVDSRFAAEIFGVAGTMLGHALSAKTAKLNKKLKKTKENKKRKKKIIEDYLKELWKLYIINNF